jgi:hypothetical protein
MSFVVQADNPTARDTLRGYAIQDVAGDGLVLAGAGDATLVIGPRASFPTEVRRIELDPAVGWGWVVRPGGDWVAYTAIVQEDGEWQVYLARTAPPWERFRVSPGGGEEPLWLPDGALAYREGNRWMAVEPPTGSGPPGVPRLLFEGPYVNVLGRSHDVDPGGRHLLVEAPGDLITDRMTVVTGWARGLPELRRP